MGGSLGKSDSNTNSNSTMDSNSVSNSSGFSGSSGNTGSNSGFNQTIFNPNAYHQMTDSAANTFNNQNPFSIGYNQNIMENTVNPWMQQMQGGAYSDITASSLMNSLNNSMDNPSAAQEINNMIMGGAGNNYADAMKSQVIEDAGKLTDRMFRTSDAAAFGRGMTGSSPHNNVQTQGVDDISKNAMDSLNKIGYDTFDKDLQRKLDIANQADANTFNRQQLMANMLGEKQNTMNTGINNSNTLFGLGTQNQMMPWQQLSAYSDVVGTPTVLSSGNSDSFGNNNSFSGNNAYSSNNMNSTGMSSGSSKGVGTSFGAK
jgi:hypothetical protein